jgi:hypothetical protein
MGDLKRGRFYLRDEKGDTSLFLGEALGDVVYYFTKRKEDQSLTEPAEIAGKGRVGLSNRERADWIKSASLRG